MIQIYEYFTAWYYPIQIVLFDNEGNHVKLAQRRNYIEIKITVLCLNIKMNQKIRDKNNMISRLYQQMWEKEDVKMTYTSVT